MSFSSFPRPGDQLALNSPQCFLGGRGKKFFALRDFVIHLSSSQLISLIILSHNFSLHSISLIFLSHNSSQCVVRCEAIKMVSRIIRNIISISFMFSFPIFVYGKSILVSVA